MMLLYLFPILNKFVRKSVLDQQTSSRFVIFNAGEAILWGRPDSNQRPPAPEAGIIPS